MTGSAPRVRVYLARTGGLAGIRLTCELDTDALDAESAGLLRALADAALDADRDDAAGTSVTSGADRFDYELTIVRGEQARRLRGGEATLTGAARALARHLERQAR